MNLHPESMITASVNVDISKYVVNQLSQDGNLRKLNTDIKKKTEDVFLGKADDMFRWAACQMDVLKELPSTRPSHLEEVLKDLPASLDETYDRMINNIPPRAHNNALVLLRWLTYSLRPLKLRELSEARIISLDTADGVVAPHDRGGVEDVLRILSGLILVIDSNGGILTESGSDSGLEHLPQDEQGSHQIIRLAHFSAQEYLESSRQAIDRPQSFHFQSEREHGILCHSCIVYRTHCRGTTITETRQGLEHFPLAEYAARF